MVSCVSDHRYRGNGGREQFSQYARWRAQASKSAGTDRLRLRFASPSAPGTLICQELCDAFKAIIRRAHARVTIAGDALAAQALTTRVESRPGKFECHGSPRRHSSEDAARRRTQWTRAQPAAGIRRIESHTGDMFSANVLQTRSWRRVGALTVPVGRRGVGACQRPSRRRANATQNAALVLDFDSLTFNGRRFPFAANVTATNLQKPRRRQHERDGQERRVGAAAGAVLGAVIGGADRDKILSARDSARSREQRSRSAEAARTRARARVAAIGADDAGIALR